MGRIHFGSLFAAATLASIWSTPGIAKDVPVVLQPSSPWNVDYGEEKCRLGRIFGEEGNRHLLFMEQWGPDTKFGFTAAGPSFKSFRGRRDTGVSIARGQEPLETEPYMGEISEYGPAIVYASLSLAPEESEEGDDLEVFHELPQIELTRAKTAEFVQLQQGKRAVKFMTGPLDKPFAVLNECSQIRLEEWGLDRAKHQTLTRMPVWTNVKAIVNRIQDSYPSAALAAGESAIVRMRVIVDEAGKVSECEIYDATITIRLDSPACRAMRSAQFEPALDADGKPMKSYFQTSITYRIN